MERNDRAMIRWICGVRVADRTPMNSLYERLGIPSLESLLRCGRLRWYGHISHSSSWISKCTDFIVPGKLMKGRPRKTWQDVINDDMKAYELSKDIIGDREKWKLNVRMASKRPTPSVGERRR